MEPVSADIWQEAGYTLDKVTYEALVLNVLSVCLSVQFCEVITVYWLKELSGHLVRVMLDYVDHVTLCSKLKAALMEQPQWPDICRLQGKWQLYNPHNRNKSDLQSVVSPLQKMFAVCSISVVCGSAVVSVAFVSDLPRSWASWSCHSDWRTTSCTGSTTCMGNRAVRTDDTGVTKFKQNSWIWTFKDLKSHFKGRMSKTTFKVVLCPWLSAAICSVLTMLHPKLDAQKPPEHSKINTGRRLQSLCRYRHHHTGHK